MFNPAGTPRKALSALIVWTIVVGGILAVVALAPSAVAGPCDQVGGVITGDWTITTAQTCSGVVYTVDGTITIDAGGSLTLTGGGLRFAKDGSHRAYSLVVQGGGDLILDGSIVTTETQAIDPYLHLALSVTGAGSSLSLRNGAVLKFPGWFNASAGATLNITDSTITGFTDADLGGLFSDAGALDGANDAPVIVWSATTASLYRSTVDRLYEHPDGAADLRLVSGSSAYAYDTYIAADHSDQGRYHNELEVDATSSAYLYNVTIDEDENPSFQEDWTSAYNVTGAGGNVYLLRWLRATVTDFSGSPVDGATVWSRLSPSLTTAQYPDNGMASVPSSRTLWYLGRAASGTSAWNRTNAAGLAVIPLYTDRINATTLPNAESFGNYEEVARVGTDTASAPAYFPAYPRVASSDNNLPITIQFSTLKTCPGTPISWSSPRTIVGSVSVARSVEVSSGVTIQDGSLYVDQQADACAYVKVLSGGTLTFSNSEVWSNYPLVVDVAAGGTLVVRDGSALLLTQRGTPGILRSLGATASVTILDSTVDGDLRLLGGAVRLVRDVFYGPALVIDTDSAEGADLWDATFAGATTISLLSDDGNAGTVDFDIRNTTFDDVLTPQLAFGGSQNVQLTSVQVDDPSGAWWDGMVSGSAVVSRYWWLTARAVDGTGTVLANANVTIDLDRLDPGTLSRANLANPAVDDIYYSTNRTWRVGSSLGYVLYRAFAESRSASASSRVVDNTYIGNASARLGTATYYADAELQRSIVGDTTMDLTFSSLTPDLTVIDIRVSGGNGNSDSQPINTPLTLIATVRNTGQIDVRNVVVSFFSDDVDKNDDNLLDFSADVFRASVGIGADQVISLVPKNGNATVQVIWTPQGVVETSRTVSAVVDPPLVGVDDPGAIRETNDRNNIYSRSFTLFTWPDLSVSSADITAVTDPVVNNTGQLRITVHNDGTNRATNATVTVLDDGVAFTNVSVTLDKGTLTTLTVSWRPTRLGNHTVGVLLRTSNTSIRNSDYRWDNNEDSVRFSVLTQPDLELRAADHVTVFPAVLGQPFTVTIVVRNIGETSASDVDVAIFSDSARTTEIGRTRGLNVRGGASEQVVVSVSARTTQGPLTLYAEVDPDDELNEGGTAQETNNVVAISVNVAPPQGTIFIEFPSQDTVVQPAARLFVSGFVRNPSQQAIPGLELNITLTGDQGLLVSLPTTTLSNGFFGSELTIPADAADGTYTITVASTSGSIPAQSLTITVRKIVPFLDQPVPLLGISWLFLLIIVAAVTAIGIGATLYYKFYGLGKMVECGECGAFIPEDATTCPKCGVEFEKDMAKCSNCQAWIPVDVKQCPECGVEFATGEVEMADYQEKMRLQYDEVVQKFRSEASRQLGRTLSDREFQEWWRKQPTFVTFEDWLREEEEMRKMGSKPCPVCGTLNSVTATVCHKCGSFLKEARPPGGAGGGGAPAPVVRKVAAPAPGAPPAPSEEPAAEAAAPAAPSAVPPEGVPRRVIRKPLAGQPVVQKKVIRRPVEGTGQTGESTEGQGSQGTQDSKEDEV